MAGIGKKYTKLEWGQKTLNGINVTFKWNGAPSNPVHPRYTWDEVELIQHAAGEDFNVWEQKDKDKLVKLILKLNAKTMAQTFMDRGINIVSNGTENHMFLVDLINKGVTEKEADAALGRANITVNKNAVPNDPQSPFVTSGIRLGTPAVTTRGFKNEEVEILTNWICDVVLDLGNADKINSTKDQVVEMCKRFPVYK